MVEGKVARVEVRKAGRDQALMLYSLRALKKECRSYLKK